MRIGSFLSAVTLFGSFTSVSSAQFALHDGDRVVFYGDSITDNAPYTNFIETYVATRFPKMTVHFVNAGVGGDRVSGGWAGPIDTRLIRDLFSQKPTVVTVMLGMNDGGYQVFNQDLFDKYSTGYQHIADRIKAELPKARVWLIQPSPYDDVTRPPTVPYGGYNLVLKKYGEFVANLAKAQGFGSIDLNTPVLEALTKAASLDATVAPKIIADRVHPWIAGHLLMAAAILRAWGAPGNVSRTEIDAQSGKVNTEAATVREIGTGERVRWVSTEESLPFPIDRKDETTNLILRSSPVEDWIGREVIVVHHLAPGDYKIAIDGETVGQFSADVFDSGIDLSWLPTPMAKQSAHVHELTLKRAALKYFLWRNVEIGYADIKSKSRAETVKAVERLEDDVIRQQHDAARPVPHRFAVTKA